MTIRWNLNLNRILKISDNPFFFQKKNLSFQANGPKWITKAKTSWTEQICSFQLHEATVLDLLSVTRGWWSAQSRHSGSPPSSTPSAIKTAIKFYVIEIEIKGSFGLEKKFLVQIPEPGQEVCGSGAALSNSALIMRLAAGDSVTQNTSVRTEVPSAAKAPPTVPACQQRRTLQATEFMKVSATHQNDTVHKEPLPPKNSIFLWSHYCSETRLTCIFFPL